MTIRLEVTEEGQIEVMVVYSGTTIFLYFKKLRAALQYVAERLRSQLAEGN